MPRNGLLFQIKIQGFPVFSTGTSTLGANGYAKVVSCGNDFEIAESSLWPVLVRSGDIILADIHGVVCIPIELLSKVANICLEKTIADEKVMQDVKGGKSLTESFRIHRK